MLPYARAVNIGGSTHRRGDSRSGLRCENRLVTHADSPSPPPELGRPSGLEDALLERVRAGDERVFAELVQDWSNAMLRLALVHVDSRAVAQEVVQKAWLTVGRPGRRCSRRSATGRPAEASRVTPGSLRGTNRRTSESMRGGGSR
jgi:hypothetical protein